MFQKTHDLNKIINQSDIIYVGGGNTKSMLAVFREWRLDQFLISAYQSGKILAGVSAGAICWFNQGVTDSWAHGLRVMDCMDVLEGVVALTMTEKKQKAIGDEICRTKHNIFMLSD